MSEERKPPGKTSVWQLGILLKPKNLLRTIASVAPGAGALLEVQSQLDGAKIDERIATLEETDVSLQTKLAELENFQPQVATQESNWPVAAGDFLRRIVDIAVVYDGRVDVPPRPGRKLFLGVAHGCFVGSKAVLTSAEAIELAKDVAEHKGGTLTIIAGWGWYDFEVEAIDSLSGLVICKITRRDDERWLRTKTKILKAGLPENMFREPLETSVKSSVSPWVGQDVGFLHTGEAADVLREAITRYQFDKTTISHFRNVHEGAIKTFVTGVLPGRICKTGSPVFGGDGTLLGVIANTENYPADAGRRAIVKSLLGHPRFTVFPKKTA